MTITPVLVSENRQMRRSLRQELRFDVIVEKPEQAGAKVDVEIPLDDEDVEAIKDLIETVREPKEDR